METIVSTPVFSIPTKAEVSASGQAVFEALQSKLGFVPNLYAFLGHNDTALADYVALQSRKATLNLKEREIVNMVTSQLNDCAYCVPAHTALGKMAGFTDEQLLDIRRGYFNGNAKFDALVKLTAEIVNLKGRASAETLANYYAAGYTTANLIDTIIIIGDKIISNYLHNLVQIPVDFPAAPSL